MCNYGSIFQPPLSGQSQNDYDLVITNGRLVPASEVLPHGLQIGILDGKIAGLGHNLTTGPSTKVIDAEGAYVTPGGIDSHVHIQQDNAQTSDTWETASRSAIAGGTTTVLAFASQKRHEESALDAVQQYHAKANGQAYCDYGFHIVLTNPTPDILQKELPSLVEGEGITSVKLYITYEPYKLNDRQLLDIMLSCRSLGMITMIHAENSDMIALVIERLEQRGNTDPFFHSMARPRLAEDEASYRAISLTELVDAPILIVHMSSETAVEHVREAQARLLPVHAETCPHYLFLLSDEIKQCRHGDDFHGAKYICAPPLRHHVSDLEGLWRGLANGTFTVWSSDHAPSLYDHPKGGKAGMEGGVIRFAKVPNGLPGIETRMALLFSQSEGCLPPEKARITLPRFVQLTATNAAKLYGLDDRKGTIMVGYDADLVIWYPPGDSRGRLTITQERLHHGVDYTPFEGLAVQNWPRYTILRGKIVWQHDGAGIIGEKGYAAIEGRVDGVLSAATCLRVITPIKDRFDAFLVCCFSNHPLIPALREEVGHQPVLGIMESALYASRMCGNKLGIITTSERSEITHQQTIIEHGFGTFSAGCVACKISVLGLESQPKEQVYAGVIRAAKELVDGRNADCICLGCAGMTGVKEACEKAVGKEESQVMVVDGVGIGIQLLIGLVREGLGTAKLGAYRSAEAGRKARQQDWY